VKRPASPIMNDVNVIRGTKDMVMAGDPPAIRLPFAPSSNVTLIGSVLTRFSAAISISTVRLPPTTSPGQAFCSRTSLYPSGGSLHCKLL